MESHKFDHIGREDTQGLIDKSLLLTVENLYDGAAEEITKICKEAN